MSYDLCIACGVLLPPQVYECPVCGFDNRLGQDRDDSVNDGYFDTVSDDFTPDEEPGY